ncbi:MAG: single-stranded-DNA-specific exonuclease RecJ [Nevskiaceae bacterium]|nr:MAG: single-stranded-DNA-specific exonuclease RecJ [Nevskiaceae bacterium]
MNAPRIRRREAVSAHALPASLPPVLRRIYGARGVRAEELSLDLKQLLPPSGLKGIADAALLLERALREGQRIVIAGDYDADGATSTALAVLALRAMGAARVDYVVPDRFRMGYGLSSALAELAAQGGTGLLITVDNGIASNAGVARAKALGMTVLITDHHLPGPELPAADAIVNPNQPGCGFASKHLAGVGVMFYLLLALRARLRETGWFAARLEPQLAEYLDLVALGTVADVVKLDHNNRILVQQGVARIRSGRARPGLLALLRAAGRRAEDLGAIDLGFVLGPRINAAGRLDDMRIGIECLLGNDGAAADTLAHTLDRLNRERREIESEMREAALQIVAEDGAGTGVCLFDASWHEGVVGLVASRIKEKLHRPAIAFARASEGGLLKGSGRSIPGLHIRDALAAVDARHPGMIERFGGHAMAAGLTLAEAHYERFSAAFDAVCAEWLDATQLEQVIETDGELDAAELSLDTAQLLAGAGPWGQGFAEPLFEGVFEVESARLVGSTQTHAKYRLRRDGQRYEAMDFGGHERLVTRGRVQLAYRLGVNRWNGEDKLDLLIQDLRLA